jgi:hypothetical protein
MTRVVVDASLQVKLPQVDSSFEFCDESGRTLGYYIPAADQLRPLYDWARAAFTDEEIQRARREPPGPTTAELLARLKDR